VPFSELEQPAGEAAVAAAAQTPHHHQQQQRQQQRWQEEQEARSLFPQADASSAAHAAAEDAVPAAAASCSTGGLMASAHVTGAAVAQQQQQQRSQATVAGAGSSSPGSSMLSLLQRIKRTMPSLRQAAGSSGGARQSRSGGGSSGGARASVSVGGADVSVGSASLHAPTQADVRQAVQQREAHDAPGTVSVDEVVLLEEQLPVQSQHQPPPQQQQQHRAKAAKDGNAAVATPNTATRGTDRSSSAAQRRQTAAQLAASLDHFRRSCTELQAVWSQLQSLGLDPHDASELSQLLTPTPPPRGGVLRTSPTTRTVQASGAGAGVAVGEPVAYVKQRLQEELLQSIWSLHAAVTSSTDAGSAHTLAQQGS
jgi:hypothetical protein